MEMSTTFNSWAQQELWQKWTHNGGTQHFFFPQIKHTYPSREKKLLLGREYSVQKGVSQHTSPIAISHIPSPLASGPWSCDVTHWKTFLLTVPSYYGGGHWGGEPCFRDISPDMHAGGDTRRHLLTSIDSLKYQKPQPCLGKSQMTAHNGTF